jgi:hypothetical protein
MNRGYDALKVMRKGGKKGSLAIRPQAAQRIRDYLELAGHGDDIEGPLFRPVKDNHKAQESRRHLAPIAIDRVLRKYARSIPCSRGLIVPPVFLCGGYFIPRGIEAQGVTDQQVMGLDPINFLDFLIAYH